jgi:signal peptidase I
MAFPPVNPSPRQDETDNERDASGGRPAPFMVSVDDGQVIESWPAKPAPSAGVGRRARRVVWELAQTLVLALLIFLAVRAMAQNFRVEGSSMEPGLHDGQYLLVNKAVYFKLNLEKLAKYVPFVNPGDNPERYIFSPPHRGDVVVFRYPKDPDRDFIKRVIAVPGDEIRIDSGVVFVNGERLDEPYIESRPNYDFQEQIVPEGSFFVLGDNRDNSFDSHAWGFVPEENIIGKAIFSYWPLESLGGVGNRTISAGFINIPLP